MENYNGNTGSKNEDLPQIRAGPTKGRNTAQGYRSALELRTN